MRPAGVGSNGLTADDLDFREMERDGRLTCGAHKRLSQWCYTSGSPHRVEPEPTRARWRDIIRDRHKGRLFERMTKTYSVKDQRIQSVRKNSITLGGMCPSIQIRTLF